MPVNTEFAGVFLCPKKWSKSGPKGGPRNSGPSSAPYFLVYEVTGSFVYISFSAGLDNM